MRASPPSLAFYRFLYRSVGALWHWTDRTRLSDAALAALVTPVNVYVHVLYLDGSPAGYVEIAYGPFDAGEAVAEAEAQIVYFGLVPEAIGRGAGRAFLDWAVREAFAEGDRRDSTLRRLRVHTCSLDHPRALATYEGAGFHVERVETSP